MLPVSFLKVYRLGIARVLEMEMSRMDLGNNVIRIDYVLEINQKYA